MRKFERNQLRIQNHFVSEQYLKEDIFYQFQFIVKRIATMPNETTIEKKGNETDQEKLNIRRIISGAEVYYNFTGEAKCLDLENQDDIGADMWDYQV